jgi:hypothetical protein
MAGNKQSAARGARTQADQAKARRDEVAKNATGQGSKPGFGTGEWARAHGLWKEGDTEGPAPKSS